MTKQEEIAMNLGWHYDESTDTLNTFDDDLEWESYCREVNARHAMESDCDYEQMLIDHEEQDRINAEIDQYNENLDNLREKFGFENVKFLNPEHGKHNPHCDDLPF